ncbi:2TM domain-containing protein [Flavobacterium sp.]|uniref:2TM domain-containing protein n=1 Tax=Flavobacterium sp. TaxID=239 RepID=UPI003528BBF5
MNVDEIKYLEAKKRVKRIKGFYTHATIFVLVNIMVFIVNAREIPAGESLFQWRTLSTPFFWGIGLLAHGLSVFLPNFILGKNWEERKIKEFMDEEKRKFQ